jgi:hypothetical protein
MPKIDNPHPLGWRDFDRGRSSTHVIGAQPYHIRIKRPDGKYCSFANLAAYQGLSWGMLSNQQPTLDYWRRCMFWSVPVVELAAKMVDNTATKADVDALRDYLNRINNP